MSVSAPATSPPVQDSAVATMSFLRLAQIEQGGRGGLDLASAIGHSPGPGQAHRGGRHGGDAFLRPVKPSCSLVVAFTATRSIDMSAISAMRLRIASRCGPMRGASQTMVTSRCAIRPPRLVTRSTANFRNWSDDAPRQRGSFGGKCLPMSPSASAPRMASTSACSATSASEWPVSAAVVRNLARRRARHDRRRRRRARRSRCRAQVARGWRSAAPRPCAKSSSVVSFTLPLSPAKCRDLDARPFGQRGVVGEIVAAFLRRRGDAPRAAPRNLKACGVCTARSVRAIDRARDMSAGIDALDRVGDLQRRDGGAGLAAGDDGARHELGRAERPRRVMHQHDVGRRARSALRGRPAPRPAALRRPAPAAAAAGLWQPPRRSARSSGWMTGLHRADLAMPGKQRQARTDHRFARQCAVLLGQIAAGAKPASGCDDHGGDRGAHAVPTNSNDPALALARSPERQKDFHRRRIYVATQHLRCRN